jgi:regulator of RNase E activity RraA
MEHLSPQALLEKLLKYSTPTVSNVVASYPSNPHCLRLYDPWVDKWYTDHSIRCIFPEMGRRAGYVLTMVVSAPDPSQPQLPSLSFLDLIDAFSKARKPIIVACQQAYREGLLEKAGLFGGQTTALFKACGVIGVVTNGPSRDIDEMRGLGVQYIMSGVTVGHGEFALRAINVTVAVAGMEVAPGDIIHMDEHGAVKFPEAHLESICNDIDAFAADEAAEAKALLAARSIEEVKEIWAKGV